MNELLATLVIVLLFVVRFAVPLLAIMAFSYVINRIYARWEAEDKAVPKTH